MARRSRDAPGEVCLAAARPLATHESGKPVREKARREGAPPLQVATWLNSKPLDLGVLRGKVILLEFWNAPIPFLRSLVPALRELYWVYQPVGLEIIAVHTPTRDPDELRRLIREYGIEYPVAIDAPESEYWGKTAETYGTRDRTHAFLIDHEGKVHSVSQSTPNGGKIVETLVSLLKNSGARAVKPVSLEIARLPDEALSKPPRSCFAPRPRKPSTLILKARSWAESSTSATSRSPERTFRPRSSSRFS